MMPAKVEIGEALAMPTAPADADGHGAARMPYYSPSCQTSGEWVNAVLATAPYLDARGLHEALAILDRAIGNVQQAKALEGMIGTAGLSSAYPSSSMPQIFAAELVRAQVMEQQEALLRQLHQLRDESCAKVGQRNVEAPSAATLAAVASAACAAMPQGCAPPGPMACPPGAVGPYGRGHAAITERVLGALGHPSLPAGVRTEEASKPGGERTRRNAGRQAGGVQTLSTSLQLLTNEDPDCLFIVRRMNKLGFKASRKLKYHFSAYGTVVRVLVAHSTVRQHGDPQCHARRRPSSLGFVQMATAASVKEVLAQGPEQEVDGAVIRVQRFERQHAEATADEMAADKYDDSVEDWDRQQSQSSSLSMASASTAATSASAQSVETVAESEEAGSEAD